MDKIIEKLEYFNRQFPLEAINDAINAKEEITEILLVELDKVIACPESGTDNGYMLHLYSIYLLAQFREKRGFKRIIDLISLAPDQVDLLLGDTITEKLSSIIYSTFDGNVNLLKAVIENPTLNVYARGAVLDAYGKLYSDGTVTKEEFLGYLRELIYGNEEISTDIATSIQNVVVDWHIFEMMDDIQYLYDRELIETDVVGEYDEFIDFIFDYVYIKNKVHYINDIIDEMAWWACFEQVKEKKRKTKNGYKREKELVKEINYDEDDYEDDEEPIEIPVKIGRNDPCSCGSGKKYKKCCLNNEPSVEVESKVKYSESPEEQKGRLRDYPSKEGIIKDNKIRIPDMYDKEAIEIDKLVYLALHHKPVPIWVRRDRYEEERIMISYLVQAFEKFMIKCKAESISSFVEYDSKHKIHYRSNYWTTILANLINDNELGNEYEDILKRLGETRVAFNK